MEIGVERRLLQTVVVLAACIPVLAGGYGILAGSGFLDLPPNVSAESHLRYLSGLLFGIGIAFWLTVPSIEKHSGRFALLTAIVFAGGLARLLGFFVTGIPNNAMIFGLAMELVVTPTIWAWQRRVARRCSES